jgi:hypothetical protein
MCGIRPVIENTRIGKVGDRRFAVPCNTFIVLALSFGDMHVQRPHQFPVGGGQFAAETFIGQIFGMDAHVGHHPIRIPVTDELHAFRETPRHKVKSHAADIGLHPDFLERRAAVIREGRIIACGPVAQLGQTDAKRITLRGTADLSGLEVRDLQRAGETTSFLYGGDMNALLAALARGSIQDLTVAEPDLDEIFLHYYQEGGRQV